MDNSRPVRTSRWLIAVIVINVFVTAYLVKTVWAQQRRIDTLERNDQITQSVKQLDSKVNDLKSKIEGLFH